MSKQHSIMNPGPEKTEYDKMRHESMRLRPLFQYGTKVLVNGFKESRWCPCGCGKLKVWCEKNI